MDVKQFFRKRLVAFVAVAALLSVGLCGQPQARADQNYQPDVNIGGTITGSKDIADYGVAEENGYIATFKNPTGDLNANIQNWNVTNNATQNTYKEATYDGTFYYDNQGEDGIIWRNAKLVLAAPTDSTSSAPRNVNVTVKGTNQFGSGLNVGDWGNTMGPAIRWENRRLCRGYLRNWQQLPFLGRRPVRRSRRSQSSTHCRKRESRL